MTRGNDRIPGRLANASRPIARLLLGCFLLLAAGQSPAQTQEDINEKARRLELQEQLNRDRDEATRRAAQAFQVTVQTTLELIQQLEAKNTAFLKRLEDLLTNDEGKWLARDEAALNAVCDLKKKPIVAPAKLKANKLPLTSVRDGLNQTLQAAVVSFTSDDPRHAEVYRIESWATECLAQIATTDNLLTDVIGKMPKDFDAVGAKTLEAVIREIDAQHQAMIEKALSQGKEEGVRLAATQAAQKSREMEMEQRIAQLELQLREERLDRQQKEIAARQREAEAQRKFDEAMAEIERMKKEAAADQQAKNVETDIKAQQVADEANKKLLIEKCRDQEVKKLLAPFLAEGYTQPTSKGQQYEKAAISFSQLRAAGALEPTREGLRRLIVVATWKGDQVRPRWPYSPNYDALKPREIEEVKKAQQYLRDLGPTMVELKKLAP